MRYLVLLLFPLHLFAFSDIGVVTLKYEGGLEQEVKIYKSEKDTVPFAITNWDWQLDSIIPSYYSYSGTSTISYFCMGESQTRYCIRKSSLPIQTFWIAKKTFISFSTWESWWEDWGQSYLGERDIIHNSPDDHSKTIKNTCECSVVMVDSLSGEWMKVIFDETCGNGQDAKCPLAKVKKPLWVRWREGDEIFLTPYIAE